MECNRCGCCCVEFSVPRITIYNYNIFLKKYPFLGVVRWGGTEKLMVPVFVCDRLVQGENDTRICSDYLNRPDFCSCFPEKGQPRPATCSIPL